MKTRPMATKDQMVSWCPTPRGAQQPGMHAEIPALRNENAKEKGKEEENRLLGEKIIAAFKAGKPGGRFVLHWRMFPNASHPDNQKADSCGCGCSCGCG